MACAYGAHRGSPGRLDFRRTARRMRCSWTPPSPPHCQARAMRTRCPLVLDPVSGGGVVALCGARPRGAGRCGGPAAKRRHDGARWGEGRAVGWRHPPPNPPLVPPRGPTRHPTRRSTRHPPLATANPPPDPIYGSSAGPAALLGAASCVPRLLCTDGPGPTTLHASATTSSAPCIRASFWFARSLADAAKGGTLMKDVGPSTGSWSGRTLSTDHRLTGRPTDRGPSNHPAAPSDRPPGHPASGRAHGLR